MGAPDLKQVGELTAQLRDGGLYTILSLTIFGLVSLCVVMFMSLRGQVKRLERKNDGLNDEVRKLHSDHATAMTAEQKRSREEVADLNDNLRKVRHRHASTEHQMEKMLRAFFTKFGIDDYIEEPDEPARGPAAGGTRGGRSARATREDVRARKEGAPTVIAKPEIEGQK